MEGKWNGIITSDKSVDDPEVDKIKTEEESSDFHISNDNLGSIKERQLDIDSYLPRSDKLSYQKRHDKQYKYNPKPLGRKNNRNFIPEDKKTEEYWQKRIKNNIAARKSREDRRKKELEILEKKAQYEKENLELRLFIQRIETENQYLLYEISLLKENKNY